MTVAEAEAFVAKLNEEADIYNVCMTTKQCAQLGMQPVHIYVLFFNDSNYAYVGQALDTNARLARHQYEVEHYAKSRNYKANVWRKHGLLCCIETTLIGCYGILQDDGRIVPAHRGSKHDIAHMLEYSAAIYCAERGLLMTNTSPILASCTSYAFAGTIDYHVRQSEWMSVENTRRWQNPEYRAKLKSVFCALRSTNAERARLSEQAKAIWERPDQHDKASDAQRIAQNRPDVCLRTSKSMKLKCQDPIYKARMLSYVHSDANDTARRKLCIFRNKMHSTRIVRFKQGADCIAGHIEPWHHCLIRTNDVIIFNWDTRIVHMTIRPEDLPAGYVKAKDSHDLLIFNDNVRSTVNT